MSTQLSAFDLVPVTSGSSASTAVSNSLDFAVQVEQFGYERLWYGEHHLNPGVIGYSPALMIALAGGVTKTIRLGAGAVLAGHRTALSVAEEFGLLEAAFPGRIDMGLGRAGLRSPGNQQDAQTVAAESDSVSNIAESHRTEHGVVIPASPDLSSLFNSPRFRIQRQLLNQPGAQPGTYDEFIADLLDLLINRKVVDGYELAGTVPVQVNPEVWVLGSSAGESSQIAGARGLRFGANYHVAPAKVLEAVADYRRAFKPNAQLAEPYVIVSAEVLVADTEEQAQRLAAGYDLWVHSIRTGQGAIYYPTPDEAAATPLSEAHWPIVADRVSTRFVGTAEQVVAQLESLRQATDADELLISTITHDHAARVRSFELLAQAWYASQDNPKERMLASTTPQNSRMTNV